MHVSVCGLKLVRDHSAVRLCGPSPKEDGSRNSCFVLEKKKKDTGFSGATPVSRVSGCQLSQETSPITMHRLVPYESDFSSLMGVLGETPMAIVLRDISPGLGLGQARVLSPHTLEGGT